MAEDVDPEELRQVMAERHFMMSQAVIERFEELVAFLGEAETALRGSGHASLAEEAEEQAAQTREEIEEWARFRDEVEAFLQRDEG